MKKKHRLVIRTILPSLVTFLLFIFISFFVALPALEDSLYKTHIDKIKQQCNTAISLLEHNRQTALNGSFSDSLAKELSKKLIKNMKYGDDNLDYFWIIDLDYLMIMHPYRTDLDNTNIKLFKDPDGTYLFQRHVNIVSEKGEGILEYIWQYKQDSTVLKKKVSYIKLYEPWGWIIGTGIYLDDMEEEISNMQAELLFYSTIITILVLFISFYIFMNNRKLEEQRQTALNDLKKSEEKFRSFAEQAVLGIMIMQKDRVLFFNKACENIFGYTAEEALNFQESEFYNKIVQEDYFDFVTIQSKKKQKGETEGVKTSYEWKALTKDGKDIWIESFSKTIYFANDYANIAIISDITKRKKLESTLHKMNENLENIVDKRTLELTKTLESLKNKNEELKTLKIVLEKSLQKEKKLNDLQSQFVAMVSHEYRTPLTVIATSVDLIEMKSKKAGFYECDKFLYNIKKSIENMTFLLEDVLRLEQAGRSDYSLKNETFELNSYLVETIQNLKLRFGEDREINTSTNNDYIEISTDKLLFNQIFENLISNAIKYSEEHSPVLINIDERKAGIEIKIVDMGFGLHEEDANTIFEPFYRNNEHIGIIPGTGLGLAIVKRCIEILGIEISVSSNKSEGTTFTLYLKK